MSWLGGLLLGLGILLTLVGGPGDAPDWTILESGGRAYRIGGAVLVPGDSLEPGDSVRSLDRTVLRGDSGQRVQLAFASVLEVGPPPGPSRAPVLRHRSGRGRARVEERPLHHRFPPGDSPGGDGDRLVQHRGLLAWDLPGRVLEVRPGTRGHWIRPGDTLPLREPPGSWRVVPAPPPGPSGGDIDRPPPRTGGVLLSPQRTLNGLKRAISGTGDPPGSLWTVFGFWPRDRWGHVYLYRPDVDPVRLRSSGPDGRLFSRDDRVHRESRP